VFPFATNGNSRLCGGIKEWQLGPCPSKRQENPNKHTDIKYTLLAMRVPSLLGSIPLSPVIYCTSKKRRRKRK